MSLSRLIARPLLASGFVFGAVNALRNADVVAAKARRVTDKVVPLAQGKGVPVPSDPLTLVRINAGVQIVGALAVGTGRAPRLGAAALAVSMIPTTVAGHAFWAETTPEGKHTQRLQFFKNASMLGGAIIAAGDTDGKPGVAWRARRAAKDARREAKHLAVSAKREARLAKAKVS
ncbi:DoxX family protein [Nocardioides dongxiaopingii]|uniref:DoxX family protein n=1 Tax=Nocardioides TaxID=1839 RepID=UPI0010C7640D|nr:MULTISPECIES: DoxX family protein [Nocardioides]QCW50362.1 DoxX family protein [Nocardioides sp. S-1144]